VVEELVDDLGELVAEDRVGFANSGGFVFVDESAEEVAAA
jgi:hypothetical protein